MQIKNVKIYGLEESFIRSGYPMQVGEPENLEDLIGIWQTEVNDARSISRAIKLANTPNGSGHNNFLKGIIVQFDLQYPEYFSPQLQRYHWIDIVSSQSKMHRITSKRLTKDDFTESVMQATIVCLNTNIDRYNNLDSEEQDKKKKLFNYIISNLPSGYLKWMGISTNYLQLKTIYSQRRTHKLNEWQEFCNWIETLPMSELITNKNK